MEFKRWDFRAEVWIEPDKMGWFVDERGMMRGSKRYFADQIPNIPVGWILTEQTPLRSKSQKSYFDRAAEVWKFPLQRARVENDVLINFECIRDDTRPPPGVEYIERPSLPDRTPAQKGATRDGNGDWSNPPVIDPE